MENIRKIVPDEGKNNVNLKEYWKVIWRKKYFLIVPLVLSSLIAIIGTRYLTPVYQSSTILSMEQERIFTGSVDRYVTNGGENRSRLRTRQYGELINTKIKSNSFLSLIIEDLGLINSDNIKKVSDSKNKAESYISPSERLNRYLIEVLRSKISVSSPTPGLYEISVLDTDPDNCHILSKKISEKYLQVMRQEKLEGIRRAGAFSNEQLAIYREKIEMSEKELTRVQREMSNANSHSNPVNSENVGVAEVKKNNLEADLETNRIALDRIRRKLVSVFDMVPTSENVSSDEVILNLENQLNAKGIEKIIMEISAEPEISSYVDEIQTLWERMRKRISSIIQTEYSSVSQDYHPIITEYFYQRYRLAHTRSMRNKLHRYIDQYNNNLNRLPLLRMEYEKLQRQIENNRTILQAFIESKASAQISEAIQSTNLGLYLSIVEKAQKPIKPIKPDKLKIILISFMFGAMCGLGTILITEYVDDSFRSIDEIQRIMELPVICTLPKTVNRFSCEKKERGRRIFIWIAGIILFISIVSGGLYYYANTLKSSGLGISVSENLKG
ncbi:MAG: GNVR domain-containing protein [Candidatus Krumholzibacteriota bacterium]|nr:GNVR domain-containing protein [Candidatus Krumholzibacteriota bacterium]